MTDASAGSDAPGSASPALRLLRRLIDVTAAELPALGWCWLYIFSVLASYYILRPIRDQMGVAGGVNNLPWLFTGTLIVMLVLNVPFSALVKLLPRRQFISLSYRFFAVTILAFGAALHWATPEQTVWVGRVLLHLDVGVQSVRRLDLLVDGGRHLQLRAGQAAVRVYRRRCDTRRDRRLEPDRVARLAGAAGLPAGRGRAAARGRDALRAPAVAAVVGGERPAASGARGAADRRRRDVGVCRCGALAVSAEHGDLPAALRGDLDVPLFQPGQRRVGELHRPRRADRVFRDHRSAGECRSRWWCRFS